MKRRLEFIFPDVKTARHAWKEMLLACVDNKNIHFIAKPDVNLGKMLHRANVFETTDMIHEGEKGILMGGALGLLAGLLAVATQPWYTDMHWAGILVITTVIGAVSGAFWLAMLGVNFTNSDLDAAKARIEKGEVMMIVSVPLKRVEEICQLVDRLHLHGQYYDVWPTRHQIFP